MRVRAPRVCIVYLTWGLRGATNLTLPEWKPLRLRPPSLATRHAEDDAYLEPWPWGVSSGCLTRHPDPAAWTQGAPRPREWG